ncbi:uncharacterized protein LOC130739946 [Lotus japonicus]|uniref:uncharacterized protein LOC130739946 n=1 Tax=Lotus japonicus TaxID=34305 RepID=UPI00258A111D|nr:uncharacterized protein LOC130739946 [Lotus japonicus]
MTSLVLETYDGQTNSQDHLLRFNVKMAISAVSDVVKCRMLPSTFRGTAMTWFMALPQGSIKKFRDFASKFLGQFSAGEVKDLFQIRQEEQETLKQYMERYSAVSARFEEAEPRTCVCAFKNGLSSGKLSCELGRKPARSMTEVRTRARDYIIEEEDDACKRKRLKAAKVSLARKWIHDKEASNVLKVKEVGQLIKEFKGKPLYSRKDSMERKPSRRATNFRRRKRPKWNAGDESAKSLLEAMVAEKGEDSEYEIDPWHNDKGRSKWCVYHNLGGHNTSDCVSLKGQIRQLIKARQPRVTGHGLDKDSMKRAPNAGNEKINMAKEKEAEEHVDDRGGTRVLLDQGSSADIIYGDAFGQLGLTDKDLMPYTGNLVGFLGKQVRVRSYVELDTVFGVGEDAEVLRIRYLVLRVVAVYNVIIGRNTLNRLHAVISTATSR